ncbi:methyltransferase domain-containing protein (plasmid) [Streptomyces sp. AHU1]|uniref:class I SAM-dependent methyltransferase n=1 Tax=Streptomyces sp. AHU1 TaxID=3377215 RepID=UPI003877F958
MEPDHLPDKGLNAELPTGGRRPEALPGHWLLASLGKRVLRPGGARMTEQLLDRAELTGAHVVELAPGLGLTARSILSRKPASYTGVEADPQAAALVRKAIAAGGTCVVADAGATGLPADTADVVLGEAVLTMQSATTKRRIVAEAVRLLKSGGRYAIHELALVPDNVADVIVTDIRTSLARAMKVNARPLMIKEWRELLSDAGLTVESVDTAPMTLLQPRRMVADEGLSGTLRFVRNVATQPDARSRVLEMRRVLTRHKDSLAAVSIVARRTRL